MSNDQIRQHKGLAMGQGTMDDISLPNPFTQVKGEKIPRGEVKDSKRKGSDQDGDKY